MCSTNRLTEIYGAGTMSRWLPWLAELQPASFLECSPALAAELGVRNGDWVTVATARASIEVRALVTARIQELRIDGRTLHHVGLNYHFGRKGLVTGMPTNELFAFAGEPNTTIQGSKVLSVNVVAGRHARGDMAAAPPTAVGPARDAGDLAALGPRVEGPHGYVGGASRAFGLTRRRSTR